MKTYAFENLDVWQCAKRLSILTYSITRHFPESERYGLSNQMRRASISVCSNLAEGSAKSSGREKARFTETSFCSLMELLNQSIISKDLGMISDGELVAIRALVNEIAVKTSRLRDSQLRM